MEKVTVSKAELVAAIEENKAKHNVIFSAAVEGYWEKAQAELQKQLQKAEVKDKAGLFLNLPYPANYEREYDRALKKLDMSVDEEITLNSQEFNQLVMNDWSWKAGFVNAATQYGTGMAIISGCANF